MSKLNSDHAREVVLEVFGKIPPEDRLLLEDEVDGIIRLMFSSYDSTGNRRAQSEDHVNDILNAAAERLAKSRESTK